MTPPNPAQVLASLWRLAGQPTAALTAVELTGADPVLPSSFAVGTAAQATVAESALAAAELWRLRTGRQQGVSVSMRDAAIEARSEHYLAIDGKPLPHQRDKIVGLYQCGDGRWVRLHTNMPHHRDGTLKLLKADYDRASVQRSLDNWKAYDLEDAAVPAGLVITATRSFAEWDAHPQGRAVAGLPLFSIEKITARWRAAAHRHQGLGPDARHRRPGVRPNSGCARRRRAADHRRAPAGDAGSRHRQRPWQGGRTP